jgi:ABC-type glycerol-3-phosphate transport system substrate-binding protein
MDDLVRYVPLYLQVRDKILKRIVDEKLGPGMPIPNEQSLAKTYGTSLSTIRQAITLLVADGVLSKKQGKGTFIAEKKSVLSFLTWIGESLRGEAILKELVSRFEDRNPNISIKVIPTTFPETSDELVRLVSLGNAPDIAHIVSPWTAYFAGMGAITPIESYLSEENIANRFADKDLVGGTYNGKLYSVAWGLSPLSLVANKNILREAGVHIDHTPLTLDEFSEICVKVGTHCEGSERYAYGLNIRHDETDFLLAIYSFLLAFGGDFVDDAGKVVFNCPENVEGFAWLRGFLRYTRTCVDDLFNIRKRFARDEIAFITDGPWIKHILEELTGQDFDRNFMVILNPTRSGDSSITWNFNHALSICSQSSDKYHAGRFIEAVTNDPELSDFYLSSIGHLPTNRNRLDAPSFGGEYFSALRSQLVDAKCINAQNSMFEKAMVLATDAVKKILFEEADIEKELNEKEYYLSMLYYG